MEKQDIQKAISELKQLPKKKFVQSYDLIINLKNFNVKTTPLDFFVTLPHSRGRDVKVAAFVDPQLADNAQKNCHVVIKETDFPAYADKKRIKQLAEECDYFIAQMNIMPKVASIFGKVLGTKGKMPNPKLGCVVPPNANLEQLVKKLKTTVRLATKKGTNLQCLVAKENQSEAEVVENILSVYHATLKQLPQEHQNVKNCALKMSMSKPVKI